MIDVDSLTDKEVTGARGWKSGGMLVRGGDYPPFPSHAPFRGLKSPVGLVAVLMYAGPLAELAQFYRL